MTTNTDTTAARYAVQHAFKTIKQTRQGHPRCSMNDGLKVLAKKLGREPNDTERVNYHRVYSLAISIAVEGDKLNV